jgi:hypothetical protein
MTAAVIDKTVGNSHVRATAPVSTVVQTADMILTEHARSAAIGAKLARVLVRAPFRAEEGARAVNKTIARTTSIVCALAAITLLCSCCVQSERVCGDFRRIDTCASSDDNRYYLLSPSVSFLHAAEYAWTIERAGVGGTFLLSILPDRTHVVPESADSWHDIMFAVTYDESQAPDWRRVRYRYKDFSWAVRGIWADSFGLFDLNNEVLHIDVKPFTRIHIRVLEASPFDTARISLDAGFRRSIFKHL